MEKGQTKQGVENLYFYLFERALHPELFRIDRVHRVEQRRYTAEIWIVGLERCAIRSKLVQFKNIAGETLNLLAKDLIWSTVRFLFPLITIETKLLLPISFFKSSAFK